MQIPLVNPVWQFLFVSSIHKSHNAVYSGTGHADVPYTQDILLAVSTIHPPNYIRKHACSPSTLCGCPGNFPDT